MSGPSIHFTAPPRSEGFTLLDILGRVTSSPGTDVQLDSEADVLGLVEEGISTRAYEAVVVRLKLPKDAIGAETTIRNRLRSSQRLNADESERLVRLLRVYASASKVFGSEEKAVEWMHKARRFIPDKPPITPVDLAGRESGARLLEEQLLRTAHGVF